MRKNYGIVKTYYVFINAFRRESLQLKKISSTGLGNDQIFHGNL